jgi:hypothetical protein
MLNQQMQKRQQIEDQQKKERIEHENQLNE